MQRSPALAGLLTLAALVVLPVTPSTGASTPDDDLMCKGQPATIVGTPGRDVLIGTSGPDVIVGLDGNDKIRGHDGDDVICGGGQDDQLYGGQGDDQIYGGGNKAGRKWGDRFYDGPGDDYMNGGEDNGYDYLYYNTATSGVVVDRGAGTVTGDSSGTDTIELIGVIHGSAFDDVMTNDDKTCEFSGKGGDDVISSVGACTLTGGKGDDVITGSAGHDAILGATGNDSLYGSGGDDYLSGGNGAMDVGDGGSGVDTCIDIEEPVSCEESALAAEAPSRRSLRLHLEGVRTG